MSLGSGYMLSSRAGTQIPAIGLGITMKTNGKSTHDAYSLFEYAIPPQTNGPPAHVHTREDESFICLAGRLDVSLGGEEFVLEFGDYLYLPRNVVHTFRTPSPRLSPRRIGRWVTTHPSRWLCGPRPPPRTYPTQALPVSRTRTSTS